MMMNDTTKFRRLAQVAASQAANATADLLQAALEGPLGAREPFTDEPIEKLADALKLAIEATMEAQGKVDPMRNQLLGACTRYLEDFA